MASLLLAVIYVAFISLGLPDGILGSAWPTVYVSMGVPVGAAGIVTTIMASGTIVSSLFSAKVLRRLGTGRVTLISVGMTAVALFGFSISSSLWMLCLWSIPYGLGAGSVDAALNNFVAVHYKARHMNWLHCFWGVGASAGPFIMGLVLMNGMTWNFGYRAIGFIQVALVLVLLAALPLWRRMDQTAAETEMARSGDIRMLDALKLPGAKQLFLAFFCYCAVEGTAGLWASSYMVLVRGIRPERAAQMASLYFLGITIGRFISGFISARLNNRRMVRLGLAIIVLGGALLLLPLSEGWVFAGLLLLGLGSAPIYPSLLHETARNLGQEHSQMIMGMQRASAYTGATLMPPLFGLVGQFFGVGLFPFFVLAYTAVMIVMTERATRVFNARKASKQEA